MQLLQLNCFHKGEQYSLMLQESTGQAQSVLVYLAQMVGQTHSRAGCAVNESLVGHHQLSVCGLWLMCSSFLFLGCALCVAGLSGAGVTLSRAFALCSYACAFIFVALLLLWGLTNIFNF